MNTKKIKGNNYDSELESYLYTRLIKVSSISKFSVTIKHTVYLKFRLGLELSLLNFRYFSGSLIFIT
jgi:hypothetical protein